MASLFAAVAQPVVGTFQAGGDPDAHALTATHRKPGLYKTFDEFKRNSPSVPEGGYRLKGRGLNRQYWNGGGPVQLEPTEDSKLSAKDLRRLYWGFCSNDTVYVAMRMLLVQQPDAIGYVPAAELGRYCQFNVMVFSDRAEVAKVLAGRVASAAVNSANGLDPALAILNMNNGLCYQVDKSLMQKILAKDAKLSEEYAQFLTSGWDAERKAIMHGHLLHAYNERHPDEVKF